MTNIKFDDDNLTCSTLGSALGSTLDSTHCPPVSLTEQVS